MAEKSVPRREDQEEFKMEGRFEGQDFFLCVVSMFAVWLCGFLLAHTHHKATWALGLLLLSVPVPEALAYSWRWSTGNQQRTPTAPQRWLKCRVHISLHCTEYEWMLQIDYSSLSLLQRHLLYSLLLIFFLFSIPLYFCNRNKSIIYKIYKRWNQTDKRMRLSVRSHSSLPSDWPMNHSFSVQEKFCSVCRGCCVGRLFRWF